MDQSISDWRARVVTVRAAAAARAHALVGARDMQGMHRA
jgi:hypothetical protein